jgi:hypothetical protein
VVVYRHIGELNRTLGGILSRLHLWTIHWRSNPQTKQSRWRLSP